MIEDIVCGKPVTPESAIWASRYHGQTFYFCSLMCRERFELEPEDYFAAPHLRQTAPPAIPALR
jgi:Cu+-exporting ATPase